MLGTKTTIGWMLAAMFLTAGAARAESTFAPVSVDLLSMSPSYSNPNYLADTVEPEPVKAPRRWSAHVSGALGYKKLDSEWSPAENQFQFGLADGDYSPPDWPFSFAAQVIWNYSDNVPNALAPFGDSTTTSAINLGIRKVFKNKSQLEPFIGGGLSIAASWVGDDNNNNNNNINNDDSDVGLGWWASAGLYWNFVENWHLGAQVEYSDVDVTLFNNKFNAGGWNFMFMVGYHW